MINDSCGSPGQHPFIPQPSGKEGPEAMNENHKKLTAHLPINEQNKKSFMEMIVKCPDTIQSLPQDFLDDKPFMQNLMKAIEKNYPGDFTPFITIAKQNGLSLGKMPYAARNNKEVVAAAIKNNINAFGLASLELRGNYDLIILACKEDMGPAEKIHKAASREILNCLKEDKTSFKNKEALVKFLNVRLSQNRTFRIMNAFKKPLGQKFRNRTIMPRQITEALKEQLSGLKVPLTEEGIFHISRRICLKINGFIADSTRKGNSISITFNVPVFDKNGKAIPKKTTTLSLVARLREKQEIIELSISNKVLGKGSYKTVVDASTSIIPLNVTKAQGKLIHERAVTYQPLVLLGIRDKNYSSTIAAGISEYTSIVENIDPPSIDPGDLRQKRKEKVRKIALSIIPRKTSSTGTSFALSYLQEKLTDCDKILSEGVPQASKFETRTLTSIEKLVIVQDTAELLTSFHEQRKIHRDIKPPNILISLSRKNGELLGSAPFDPDLICPFGSIPGAVAPGKEVSTNYEYWDRCAQKGYPTSFTDIHSLAITLGNMYDNTFFTRGLAASWKSNNTYINAFENERPFIVAAKNQCNDAISKLSLKELEELLKMTMSPQNFSLFFKELLSFKSLFEKEDEFISYAKDHIQKIFQSSILALSSFSELKKFTAVAIRDPALTAEIAAIESTFQLIQSIGEKNVKLANYLEELEVHYKDVDKELNALLSYTEKCTGWMARCDIIEQHKIIRDLSKRASALLENRNSGKGGPENERNIEGVRKELENLLSAGNQPSLEHALKCAENYIKETSESVEESIKVLSLKALEYLERLPDIFPWLKSKINSIDRSLPASEIFQLINKNLVRSSQANQMIASLQDKAQSLMSMTDFLERVEEIHNKLESDLAAAAAGRANPVLHSPTKLR